MKTQDPLTIGDVARLAGVTVRTLHHYDAIGLVTPKERADNGYRLYGRAEIERLQEVLFLRELGFALDEIRAIVGQPDYSRVEALYRQRDLLEAKAGHLLTLVDAVDTAIRAEETGMKLTNEEMLEVFGDFDPHEYEAEAKERWGDTDAYRESAKRTARCTKADWERLGAEADELNQRFLRLMTDGVAANSEAAMDVAEAHRDHIGDWFYECSREMHAGLGQMYITDQRFQDNIDKAGEGLAEYMAAAIVANAAR